MKTRIAWGITGSGDLLPEIFEVLEEISRIPDLEITVGVSKAAVPILRWYGKWEELSRLSPRILVEEDSNTPFLAGELQTGRYLCFLIMPVTANTAAKIAHGIADTLITNSVAQAQKGRVPVLLYPVDQHPGIITAHTPDGKVLELEMREMDLENTARLKGMRYTTVLGHPSEASEAVRKLLGER